MARKVFISFLGGTNYQYCDYQKDGVSYGNVRFIQEATLNYLNVNEKWTANDVLMILLTKGACDSNWVDNGQKNNKTGELIRDEITHGKLEGLETRLKQFNIKPCPVFGLPNGNDEKEIWEIFNMVFENVKEGDQLYFDITHGFRYLPMLILVLCNYSKFLKNVSIQSITYGNYEVAKELGHGTIVDLLPLSQLQDWTHAAATYLDSGNSQKLVEMKDVVVSEVLHKIIDMLNVVTKERQTCRGLQIHNSENLKVLQELLSNYIKTKGEGNPEEGPLHQVLKKVDESLKVFDTKSNFMNGFYAAKWCVRNGLYQQAITLLRENFVTLFCERHGLDIANREMREIVEFALAIQINHNESRQDRWLKLLPKPEDLTEDKKNKIADVLSDDWIMPQGKHNNELIHLYKEIRDYRNNFNHAGFNTGASSPEVIEAQVNEFVNRAVNLFQKK